MVDLLERQPEAAAREHIEARKEAEPALGLGTFAAPERTNAVGEPVAAVAPSAAIERMPATTADPLLAAVQGAMAGGLDKHIGRLPPDAVRALDVSGDALAAEFRRTLGTKAFHIGTAARRVEHWLLSATGMHGAFATQHTKVVSDRLARLNDEHGTSSSVL